MSVFRFRQFEVRQSQSAMKVGTDSVLLGCLAQQPGASTILDIGTGTGLLSLMMAQHFPQASIDAVEVDSLAYEEASFNAGQSPWGGRIDVHYQTFQEFVAQTNTRYDLIISNPPYYKASDNVKIEDRQRSNARHDGALSFDDLLQGCAALLITEGTCWLILPRQESEMLLALTDQYGLYLHRRISISPRPSKEANRIILCLGKTLQQPIEESLTIYNEDGSPTKAYFGLTREFLLWEKGGF